VFRSGGEIFRWRGVTIQITGGQLAVIAVLANEWGEDKLVAELGRAPDLNRRRNGLEGQLVGILAEAIQAISGK
jgi:hypothetical protein